MTTIPVDLGWLIVAVFIITPALCSLTTVGANHFYTRAYRKWLKTCEQHVRDAEKTVADRMFGLDEREDAVSEREINVFDRELALGRAAHDAAKQAKAALYQATNDDTQIAIPRLEL